MLIIKFAIKQTRRFSTATDGGGYNRSDILALPKFVINWWTRTFISWWCAILAAENKRSFYVTARVKKEGVQALSLRLHKSTVKNVQRKYIFWQYCITGKFTSLFFHAFLIYSALSLFFSQLKSLSLWENLLFRCYLFKIFFHSWRPALKLRFLKVSFKFIGGMKSGNRITVGV